MTKCPFCDAELVGGGERLRKEWGIRLKCARTARMNGSMRLRMTGLSGYSSEKRIRFKLQGN